MDMQTAGAATTPTTRAAAERGLAAVAVPGLAVGAVLGLVGDQLPLGAAHVLMLLASSVGLVVGTALLAYWHLRQSRALVGAGFAVLTVAEMVMWSTGGPLVGVQSSFGAAVAFYVPALLLIGVPAVLPVWSRVAGALAAVPFGALATITLTGGDHVRVLQEVGYGLLTVALIGWALHLVREFRSSAGLRGEPEPAR